MRLALVQKNNLNFRFLSKQLIVDICLLKIISSKYHKAAVHTKFPGGRKVSQRLANKIEISFR